MFVYHREATCQIDILQEQQESLNRLPNSLFCRWMNLKPHYARCTFRGKTDHIREVRIQCDKNSSILNGEISNPFVCGAGKSNL